MSFGDPAVGRFRAEAREWIQRTMPTYRLPPGADEERILRARRAWEQEVFRAGYSCLSWPTAFGGRGLGTIEEFVFSDECAAAGTPEGIGRVGRLMAGPALMRHGSASLQAELLPRIVNATDVWCQGFSEPGAGSDLASLRTSARRDGDRYLVNGQKLWTSFSSYADWCLLLVRTGTTESRHRGLTMLAMPMRQPGVRVRPLRQITGRSEFSEVFAEDAVVPADHRIGEEGEGWAVALTILGAERGAGFAAITLKAIRDDLAVLRHCVARGTLEGELGPATRYGLLRWQAMRTIEADASGLESFASSSILKLTWSELAQDIVRLGFESGCAEHRDRWRDRLLDTRETTIASGTSEIQRGVIAERVLGLPR